MSIEENKAIVRRLWEELFQNKNTAIVDELFAPAYVRRMAGAGWETTPGRGPEVYRSDMKAIWPAFPDATATIEQLIAEGDRVATLLTFSGTHHGDWPGPNGVIRATGRRVTLPIAIVYRISEGKIVEDWESDNNGSVWQQLGAVASPEF